MQAHPVRSEFDIRQSIDWVRTECFRQFHDFLAVISAQGLIVEFNQAAEAVTGCRAGEQLKFRFNSAPWWFTDVDRRACLEGEMAATNGKLDIVKLRLKNASGQIIALEFVFQPILDCTKMIIGILVHGRPAIIEELPFGRA